MKHTQAGAPNGGFKDMEDGTKVESGEGASGAGGWRAKGGQGAGVGPRSWEERRDGEAGTE